MPHFERIVRQCRHVLAALASLGRDVCAFLAVVNELLNAVHKWFK